MIRPQRSAPFYNRTLLGYVRETGIPRLYTTRHLLDAATHGNFTSSLEDRRRAGSLLQPGNDLSDPEAPKP